MNLARKDSEDYITFAFVGNKHCDIFKQSEYSAKNFKFLIFVQGVVSGKEAEIRHWLLNKLENEPNLTQQQIAEESQIFVSIRQDSKIIEVSGIAHLK